MTLNVKTSLSSYDVTIEQGALSKASTLFDLNRKVLIVSDSNIPSDYIRALKNQCKDPYLFVFKAGEGSKNLTTYTEILECLLNHNFTRKDCVVALGGGVTGDMAGFAAATYMRGIDFYNIPTTFLSMVDSSIGGKTAVDLNGVKNIVGAFYPPKGVLIDVNTLKTLDIRQIHAGLAESIKMAMTSDEELLSLIERSQDFYKDASEIIYRSLSIKKMVVEEDEKENGLRRILNFGHTIGHAIETLAMGNLLHGECVAIGMTYFTKGDVKERLIKVLQKYQLPTSTDFKKDEIVSLVSHDKKSVGEGVHVVFVNKIGTSEIRKLSLEEIGGLL